MNRLSHLLAAAVVAISASSCGILGNTTWDSSQLGSAMGKTMAATSITDAQIVELCRQSTANLDKQNKIETGKYHERLMKLVKSVNVQGLDLNFKVYQTTDVNAFASADGSVRVYTGLMDVMDDDELIAIIGHEVGHVVKQHVKSAIKKQYMTSAARDVVNAAGSVGMLSQTVIGDVAETLANSQFSQKHEYEADEFGFQFAIDNGHSPYSMYSALNKLSSLSSGSKASVVAKMFSSHPDSQKRAAKMKEWADKYAQQNK